MTESDHIHGDITGKSYCVTVSLEGMIKRGPAGCVGMLQDRGGGEMLSGQEAYDLLWQTWLDGFEVMPVCDNHDAKGHCLGHVVGS